MSRPQDEEEAFRETCAGLHEMLGEERLLRISAEISKTEHWHPPNPSGKCICPALMAYTLLYQEGFGVMPLEAIQLVGPELDRIMAEVDAERRKLN